MINKKIIVIGLFLSCLIQLNGFGQQDPMYTQYMFNTLAFNPAYAGNELTPNATALYRSQWRGLKGAPTTQTFCAHSPVYDKMSLGISLVNDKVGPVKQTMIFVDYAYTLRFSGGDFSLGLKGGGNLLSADLTKIDTNNPDEIDPVFATGIKSVFAPNVGFGTYYRTRSWYAGFSIPKLIENKYNKGLQYSEASEKRHYFLTGGYEMNVTYGLRFKPSFLAKITEGAPISYDITASFYVKEVVWLGVSHRIKDSFSFIMEIELSDQTSIGYAYDWTISDLASSSRNINSHEIMLSVDFLSY